MEILTRQKNERLIITTPNGEEITLVITETTEHHVNFSVDIPKNYNISMTSDLLNWAYET
jgi:sRNA-binding carbon storage regulator CsrA